MRATYEGAVVILASATPSLESYFNHLNKKINYLHLPERFGGAQYPRVHLVDMLSDQEESGKFGQIISGLLQDKIEDRLKKSEQIILLQNRRFLLRGVPQNDQKSFFGFGQPWSERRFFVDF